MTERRISPHALGQAARRGVDEATLDRITGEPEQVITVYKTSKIAKYSREP